MVLVTLTDAQKAKFLERYSHLPKPFMPWQFDESDPRKLSDWICELYTSIMPLRHIPNRLYLRRGYHFQPPRFDFGWAMDRDTMYEVAQRCGFTHCFQTVRKPLPDGRPRKPVLNLGAATDFLKSAIEKQFPEILRDLKNHPIRSLTGGFNILTPSGDNHGQLYYRPELETPFKRAIIN
ncbi:hypothetical protein CC1G_05601 [Coprinopsis cinerea okayama7|uniref:Uncharacterized protein n=1 Tax=Coprinopsis cinerea (strain Okayama-7 / 130 / ATCC MYA-4618 / FGSC 9003) TaxID=240176 RepID=A8P1K8_COPC7|nr:hypothetical protein CC1G_05601 [Coprinopsis cinerea okayama7\|eukprot:XP_001838120.1 hypothetical protein CC1G_05601 [Coprinopsis cinerea okayama7\